MRSALASVVGVVAVLVMLVSVGCNDSPMAPSEELVLPQAAVSGAAVGSEGHGEGTVPLHSNAAVVFRGDLGCGLIDGNGEWFPAGFPDTDWLECGTEVATYSKNGNARVSVHTSGVPNPTGRTIHWGPYNPGADWVASYPGLPGPPYPCIVAGPSRDFVNDLLYTVNWHATVTPSGEATLTCIYSKQWEFEFPQ